MSKTSVHSAPVTVLVVDDHAPFRAVLKALLAQAGVEVTECRSAVEALRRCEEFQPGWVLMDVEMPEMDGITATRALKDRRPQTRIVIVTQYDDPDLRAEAARAGACAYVLKDDLTALTRIFQAGGNAVWNETPPCQKATASGNGGQQRTKTNKKKKHMKFDKAKLLGFLRPRMRCEAVKPRNQNHYPIKALKAVLSTAVVLSLTSISALAARVQYQISLTATIGSQFGVSAPATVTGTFTVDSTFLNLVDGVYGGENVSNFHLVIGTQTFYAATAFSPDIQGVKLVGNKVVGMAMNWSQTSSELLGPFLQMAVDGTWYAGSTVAQDGSLILHGPAGSQAFSVVPSVVAYELELHGQGTSFLGTPITFYVHVKSDADGNWTGAGRLVRLIGRGGDRFPVKIQNGFVDAAGKLQLTGAFSGKDFWVPFFLTINPATGDWILLSRSYGEWLDVLDGTGTVELTP